MSGVYQMVTVVSVCLLLRYRDDVEVESKVRRFRKQSRKSLSRQWYFYKEGE